MEWLGVSWWLGKGKKKDKKKRKETKVFVNCRTYPIGFQGVIRSSPKL